MCVSDDAHTHGGDRKNGDGCAGAAPLAARCIEDMKVKRKVEECAMARMRVRSPFSICQAKHPYLVVAHELGIRDGDDAAARPQSLEDGARARVRDD